MLVQYETKAPSERLSPSFSVKVSVKDEQLIRVSHAATATPFLMVIRVLCQRNDKGEKCKIWMSTVTDKEEGLNRAQNENIATRRSYDIKKDPFIVVFSGERNRKHMPRESVHTSTMDVTLLLRDNPLHTVRLLYTDAAKKHIDMALFFCIVCTRARTFSPG